MVKIEVLWKKKKKKTWGRKDIVIHVCVVN